MESPYMKGLIKKKNEYLFPASPTLLHQTNLDYKTKEKWLLKRKRIILAKTNPANTYDSRLRPYQNQDVNFLIQFNKGKGVFNQQRVGKTPTTLITLKEKNQNKNIIIVPKSMIPQWKKEYEKWHQGKCFTTKDHHSKQKRIEIYKNNEGTLITNYDKIRIDLNEIIEHIASNGLDAVVLDEAHMLRNYKGMSSMSKTPKTVKNIIELRNLAADAYALTGTPTPNKAEDICGILAFLFPELFKFYWPTIEYYFNIVTEMNYQVGKEYRVITDFKDDYKKQEMLEFLETFTIERKRKEVMKWLPKVDKETVFLDPTKQQTKWFKEVKEYFEIHKENEDNIMFENHLTAMIGLRQLALDPSIYNLKSKNPKFEWIKSHIEDYPETPIIIVGNFSRILRNLQKYLQKYNPEIIYGATSSEKRQETINKFQKGEINILIANIQVAKEGLTLSRAEEIIFLDPSLTYTDNEQMQDRFLPITEKEAINKEGQKIIKLILRKSIDLYINRSLKRKQEDTDIINNYINHLKGGELSG